VDRKECNKAMLESRHQDGLCCCTQVHTLTACTARNADRSESWKLKAFCMCVPAVSCSMRCFASLLACTADGRHTRC
jgi:hypothetical protein